MIKTDFAVVHHGTTFSMRQRVLEQNEDIYGYVVPGLPDCSGNLTDNLDLAREFAEEAVIESGKKERPDVLSFRIPNKILIDCGLVKDCDTLGARAYAVSSWVEPSEVPDLYLNKTGISRKEIEERKILIYRLSHELAIR